MIHKRGLAIKKNTLLNLLKDETYKRTIEANTNSEHVWFKKTILYINKENPTALFTL